MNEEIAFDQILRNLGAINKNQWFVFGGCWGGSIIRDKTIHCLLAA
jgi:hypothetical protein